MIVAPHEVSEANINRLQQMLKKPAARFSEAGKTPIEKIQVLLIDSIGMLSSLYRYGNIAYIGGGFGVGIHNILEPATFGLPVIFGPNYTKFKEAVELISLGGAFPVHNFKELEITLKNLWEDPTILKDSSTVSKKFVEKNVGSTNLIIRKVFNK